MSSRFIVVLNLVLTLLVGSILTSCQDTIPNRSTISPSKVTAPDDDDDDDTVTRPTGAIKFKSDFCTCKDGKAISYGNCASFCANKVTNGAEVLYANFTVTEAISLSGLGNVHGWCTALLPDDEANPKCVVEAKAEDGTITTIDATPISGTNSITAKVQEALDYDKTYVLTLVESISKARSDSVQLVKFSSEVGIPTLGPLKNAPISQYTCIVRDFSTDSNTGVIYYDTAYRMHFYYLPRFEPSPIPGGNSNLICHDIFNPLYGNVDKEEYPRLENIPGVFNLWDTSDPRFYDNNGTGSAQDVNDIIVQKTKNFGGSIPASTVFFNKFSWPGAPNLSEDAGNTTTSQEIGYFMAPWIDQSTFKSYCLTSTHYNSDNALFKALRDVIQVDTEGLYIGEKAPESVTDSSGNTTSGYKDYILIRETDLKQVWFYLNNGVPTKPSDSNVSNVTVYFYYPLNKTSPFVKTSTQRIYRVRGANELNGVSNNTNTNAGSTSYPPHDRKIGCVPKF